MPTETQSANPLIRFLDEHCLDAVKSINDESKTLTDSRQKVKSDLIQVIRRATELLEKL